jgi:membrane-associated phospholipid phosphatase
MSYSRTFTNERIRIFAIGDSGIISDALSGASVFLYPSGHLAVATALVLTLILVVRSAGARPSIRVGVVTCASLFVLVMARARLAETAHSLSDVVGGVATGAAVTLAAALLLDLGLLRFMSHKRTMQRAPAARSCRPP